MLTLKQGNTIAIIVGTNNILRTVLRRWIHSVISAPLFSFNSFTTPIYSGIQIFSEQDENFNQSTNQDCIDTISVWGVQSDMARTSSDTRMPGVRGCPSGTLVHSIDPE